MLHTLFGDGPWSPRLAQAFLGASACAFLAASGARFFDRRTGVVAGVGLALYAPAIFFDGLIQKASLDGFFTALLLLAFSAFVDRDRPWLAFASGVVLGLLALLRENALVLAPLAAAFVVVAGPARPALRRVLALALLALGLALPLLPVGLRNQAIGGRFLVTTSQLGPNLWIGNHAGRERPLRAAAPRPRQRTLRARRRARARGAGARPRALARRGVRLLARPRARLSRATQPGDWLRLLAHKWALVWNARELPGHRGHRRVHGDQSSLLRALHALFGFGLLAPLALAGIVGHACGLAPALGAPCLDPADRGQRARSSTCSRATATRSCRC